MMPIGPLMIEHRWIERVIVDLKLRLDGQSPGKGVDSAYVERVVDFLRSYADRCHHGKEEDILFSELANKDLEPTLDQAVLDLIKDHEWARATTRRLVAANGSLAAGEEAALVEVRHLLGELAHFYPQHIEREDKGFFRPVMAYFSASEQADMLGAFSRFDATLIHEKYQGMARDLVGKL